jgi:hypothetical protein
MRATSGDRSWRGAHRDISVTSLRGPWAWAQTAGAQANLGPLGSPANDRSDTFRPFLINQIPGAIIPSD